MAKVEDLLNLAQGCHVQARKTLHLPTKQVLTKMGDGYLKQADDLQRGQAVIQTAFPKPGGKIG